MSWPRFAGELKHDADELASCATDFGRLRTATPSAVLRAASPEDVLAAIGVARERRMRVVARGQAHTTRGQSLCSGGLVVDLGALDRVLEIGADFVRVQAGARWQELLRATLESGLTPPVLTDYLDLSIGGTLSLAGVGGQSFRHGFQLDTVLELLVATGTGEAVRCSPSLNRRLFDACRGGMGQFGLILEAKLALVPAPRMVRAFKLEYDDLRRFLGAQLSLADDGRFDYLLGNFTRPSQEWCYDLDCVQHLHPGAAGDEILHGLDFIRVLERRDLDYFSYANRLSAMVTEMRRRGTWQGLHPWVDFFLPASRAARVIEATLNELERDEISGGYVMTYPLTRGRCRSLLPGLPDEPQLFLFDILPSFAGAGAARLTSFEKKCESLHNRAREVGATVYPIGFPVGTIHMQSREWQRQLGAAYPDLARLKREVDPDGVMGSDLAIFSA